MKKIYRITKPNGKVSYEYGEKISDWLFGDNRSTHELIEDLVESELNYLRTKEFDIDHFNDLVWKMENMDLVEYLASRGYRNFEIDRDILDDFISKENDPDKLTFLNHLKDEFQKLIDGENSDKLFERAQDIISEGIHELDVGSIEEVSNFLGVKVELWGWVDSDGVEIPMSQTLICPSCECHSLTEFDVRKKEYESDHDAEYTGEVFYCFECGQRFNWNDEYLIKQNSHLKEEFWLARSI